MNIIWVSHLKKEEERKEFAKDLSHFINTPGVKRLLEIIENEIKNTENKDCAYDNSAWPYKQAHNNGMRQAYSKIKDLLTT